MANTSTRLKFAFVGCLLGGFLFIQYHWVSLVRKEKLESARFQLVSGMEHAANGIAFEDPAPAAQRTILDKLLRQSFSQRGLGHVPFEFSLESSRNSVASPGFTKKLLDNPNSLRLEYPIGQADQPTPAHDLLVLVVPSWRKMVLSDMTWIMMGSLLLTLLIGGIFYGTYIWVSRRQQLYNNRSADIERMIQQLETPLSTVSVAAQALGDAKVLNDTDMITYYQQIINKEVQRMNEEVNKLRSAAADDGEAAV